MRIVFFISVFTISIFLSTTYGQSGYEIIFEKIDNRAEVYVGDSLVYNSGYVSGNPELNIHVRLTEFLKPGENKVIVVLYNGRPTENEETTTDKYWEIRYEILDGVKSIEYEWDSNDDFEYGKVYAQEFYFEI